MLGRADEKGADVDGVGVGRARAARVVRGDEAVFFGGHLIYFLYLFTKGDAENISADGKKAVRQIAEQIKMEHRR